MPLRTPSTGSVATTSTTNSESLPDLSQRQASPVLLTSKLPWRHARRTMEILSGRGTRLILLIASLLGGLVIALLTVHLAGRWQV